MHCIAHNNIQLNFFSNYTDMYLSYFYLMENVIKAMEHGISSLSTCISSLFKMPAFERPLLVFETKSNLKIKYLGQNKAKNRKYCNQNLS